MKRLLILFLVVFSCANEPFETIENEVFEPIQNEVLLFRGGDWTKMCDLQSIGTVSYSVQQFQGTSYWVVGSNGTREPVSFSNAVAHCCEFGTGDGCDFPPEPGTAKSYYVDKMNE